MRSDAASSPSDRPAASSRAASRPQIATRAPPRKSSRAVARPIPDDPPVTTATRSSSPKESMRAVRIRPDLGRLRRTGFFDGFQLGLRSSLELAAHARKPGVMLIEKLARSRSWREILEHDPVLFEHRPVQPLKLCPVHELPDIPHPTLALSGTPEEDKAIIFIDGRNKTSDAKI